MTLTRRFRIRNITPTLGSLNHVHLFCVPPPAPVVDGLFVGGGPTASLDVPEEFAKGLGFDQEVELTISVPGKDAK